MYSRQITFLAATTSCVSLLSPTLMAQPAARGGPAGPGNLGSNLVSLAMHPAVHAELRVTAEQRSQLKALSEKDEQQRQRWIEQVGLGRPGTAANSPGGGGRGEPPQPLAVMVETRLGMQQTAERAIGRILSKAQYARIRQIQLQVEGPNALLRPELQERLYLSEDQISQIRELMLERRQAQRTARDARNTRIKAARNPDSADRAAGDQARRGIEQDPESRNQVAAFRAEDQDIEKQFHAALHSKVLTRRQSQTYKAMLGPPFDPARLPAEGHAGPGGNQRGMPIAKAPTSSQDGQMPKDGASSQPASRATTVRRPSLRERRGLGTSDGRP